MKKIYLLFLILFAFTTSVTVAQSSHDKISYQSVVRDGSNHLLYDTQVTVAVSIKNSGDPAVKYSETHTVTSNANGLISFLIGAGNNQNGNWNAVQWNHADITLVTSVNGTVLSTHTYPLSAVPYALYAKNADTTIYADSVNLTVVQNFIQSSGYLTDELQVLSISNDTIYLSKGGWVKLPAGFSGDYNDLINKPDLKPVATSGDYNDLTNKPDINNATLTIQKNGTGVGTFTANDNTDKEINITVPTKTSELNNDSGFITADDIPDAQVQSDWNQTTTTAVDYIKNKPNLATVATSGNYSDLNGAPNVYDGTLSIKYGENNPVTFTANQQGNSEITIPAPAAQVQSNWTETDNTKTSYIQNKPELSAVATSGSYDDLSNKPNIYDGTLSIKYGENNPVTFTANQQGNSEITIPAPAAQVQSDWAETDDTKTSYIQHKPNLAAVATSGNYSDLNGAPNVYDGTLSIKYGENNPVTFTANQQGNSEITIPAPAAQVQSDWTETDDTKTSYIQHKPNLAAVATSGNYSDLNGAPNVYDGTLSIKYGENNPVTFTANQQGNSEITIPAPAAQVQSDWTETDDTKTSYIQHKPNLAAVATSGDYSDLNGAPNVYDGTLSIKYGTDDPVNFTANQQGNSEISIPAPNNATINITTNGTSTGVTNGSFTLNQSEGRTIDIALPTTVAELTDANKYAKINGNTFTGAHSFTSSGTSITVPSNTDAIKRPVPATTPAAECTNLNAVNVCDLLAVFDSLRKRIDSVTLALAETQQELDELKNSIPPMVTLNLSEVVANKIKATATVENNGSPITTFKFCISENSDMSNPTCSGTITGNNDTYEYTFENLTGNKEYYVTATATNVAGPGTDTKNSRTPAHAPTATLALNDTVPAGFTVNLTDINLKEFDNGTVKVCYKEKGESECPEEAPTDATCLPDANIAIPDGTNKLDTIITVTGLSENTFYCVYVTVANADSSTLFKGNVKTGPDIVLEITAKDTVTLCGNIASENIYTAVLKTQAGEDVNSGYTYTWSVPSEAQHDENDHSKTHTVTYNVTGTYLVTCTVTKTGETDPVVVKTVETAVVSGAAPEFSVCEDNLTVSIKGLSENASTISWKQGADPVPVTEMSSYTYDQAGTYLITVYREDGCSASESVTVAVADPHSCPVAAVHDNEKGSSSTAIDSLKDVDGNWYAVVQIGNQCWMKSNLRTTRFSDNTAIENGTSTVSTLNNEKSDTSPYYYKPEETSPYYQDPGYDNPNVANNYYYVFDHYGGYNETVHGLYYNWAAAMHGAASSTTAPSGVQGVCPEGWHLPSDAEWDTLTNYLNSMNGVQSNHYAYLIAGGCWWKPYSETSPGNINRDDRNETGFSAIASGYAGNRFDYTENQDAFFWTSTYYGLGVGGDAKAYTRKLTYTSESLKRSEEYVDLGFPVRCLRDKQVLFTVTADEDTLKLCPDREETVTVQLSAEIKTEAGVQDNYTYSWSSSHDQDFAAVGTTVTVTYAAAGTVTVTCTATPTGGGDPLTKTLNITLVEWCPCTVLNRADHEVEGTISNTITAVKDAGAQNTYSVVQIGGRCWMAENMRSTQYFSNPSSLTLTPIADGSYSDAAAYYGYPDNNSDNVSTYGLLYNWYAAMGGSTDEIAQGICPDGWHVPSLNDIENLIAKWGNVIPGFNLQKAGRLYYDQGSVNQGDFGTNISCWSSTTHNDTYVNGLQYPGTSSSVILNKDAYLYSIRCIRNDAADPTVSTVGASVNGTTATLTGSVWNPDHVTINSKGFKWKVSTADNYADIVVTDNPFTADIAVTNGYSYTYFAYISYGDTTVCGDTLTFLVYEEPNLMPCTVVTKGDNEVGENGIITAVKDADADPHTYKVVQIGSQCWMAENLRSTANLIAGTVSSATDPYYYDNANSNIPLQYRGLHYNWVAVMNGADSSSNNPSGVQGICPAGWHVPSKAEWNQLNEYMRSNSSYQCGSSSYNIACAMASALGWNTSTGSCTPGADPVHNNASGFSAVPAGDRHSDFREEGDVASFWSSSMFKNSSRPYYYEIRKEDPLFTELETTGEGEKAFGLSVRCVRNPNPTVTTSTASVDGTTVTFGGTIANGGDVTIGTRGFKWKENTPSSDYTNEVLVEENVNPFTKTIDISDAGNYVYYAFITIGSTTVTGDEVQFSVASSDPTSFTCGSTVSDADQPANTYTTVQIGTQCWIKENLKSTKYSNGLDIPTSGRYAPNGDANNVSSYGYLYNWNTTMNANGICPSGWHVPSKDEFTTMITNGGVSYFRNQFAGIWSYDYPQGYYYFNDHSVFWTSTENNSYEAYDYEFTNSYSAPDVYDKLYAMSVRCVREVEGSNPTQTAPTVTTGAATVTSTSATLNAEFEANGNVITEYGFAWKVKGSSGDYAEVTEGVTHTDGTMSYSFTGDAGTYVYHAFVTYSGGTVSDDNDVEFTIPSESPTTSCTVATISEGVEVGTGNTITAVKDVDNNSYSVVEIGGRCWMNENLKSIHYKDGDNLIDITGKYNPGNVEGSANTLGYLYNWTTAMNGGGSGSQGICPVGWHIPTKNELEKLCGNSQPYVIPSAFNLQLAGYLFSDYGLYDDNTYNNIAYWWSSNAYMPQTSYDLEYNATTTNIGAMHKDNYYLSVRCVRNSNPTVTTGAATDVTSTSATLNAEFEANGNDITGYGFAWKVAGSSGGYTEVTEGVTHNYNDGTMSYSFIGQPGTYAYHGFITYSDGTVSGSDVEFTIPSESPATSCTVTTIRAGVEVGTGNTITAVKDNDDTPNEYSVVEIGGQCWMRENMKGTKYSPNLTQIQMQLVQDGNYSSSAAYYGYPGNVSGNEISHGLLYNLYAATGGYSTEGTQGICPDGWHLPTRQDFLTLLGTNNSIPSDFNVQTAGELVIYDGYIEVVDNMESANYWSSSKYQSYPYILSSQYLLSASYTGSLSFYSVRCVRDAESGGGSPSTDGSPTAETCNIVSLNNNQFKVTLTGIDFQVSTGGKVVVQYKCSNNCWSNETQWTTVEYNCSGGNFEQVIQGNQEGGYDVQVLLDNGEEPPVLKCEAEGLDVHE